MRAISSSDNKQFKNWQKLAYKKYRDRTGRFLIEEVNLLAEAFASGIEIETILVQQGCKDHVPASILQHKDDLDMVELTRDLFSQLCETVHSRGVMGVVKKPSCHSTAEQKLQGQNVVVLDRLQDPGNVGTIIRSAEAAGFGGIVVVKGTTDIYAPKVLRASTGSIFRMPVLFVDHGDAALKLIRSLGMKSVVSCLRDSELMYDVDLSQNIALIVGNEGQGASDTFLKDSDIRVHIPMQGSTESLNAGVAASLLMYESYRQKRA